MHPYAISSVQPHCDKYLDMRYFPYNHPSYKPRGYINAHMYKHTYTHTEAPHPMSGGPTYQSCRRRRPSELAQSRGTAAARPRPRTRSGEAPSPACRPRAAGRDREGRGGHAGTHYGTHGGRAPGTHCTTHGGTYAHPAHTRPRAGKGSGFSSLLDNLQDTPTPPEPGPCFLYPASVY